jgi:hypothetical protein
MTQPDDYLWDKSGPPDPDIVRLERLLAPLRAAPRRPARRLWLVAAATLAAAAGLFLFLKWPGPEPLSGPALVVAGGERRVLPDEWLESGQQPLELHLGQGISRLTLAPSSRLQVKRLADEEARLYLQVGRLDAFVSLDAKPRFFQVETPASRCVDLGCKYSLTVDADGNAEVQVTTGRVQFEHEGRELYVPRGATCRVDRKSGRGTPRFTDSTPELRQALDRWDRGDRAAAAAVFAAAQQARDTLPVWHLLHDQAPEVSSQAEQTLARLAGVPVELQSKQPRTDVPLTQIWREHLEGRWW